MAKAKKLPSGSWRVNQFVGRDDNGKQIFKSFTAPTKKEAEFMAAEYALKTRKPPLEKTLGEAIDDYINMKSNVLSPTTLQSYRVIRRNDFQLLMDVQVKSIDNDLLQEMVNREAARKSPKSVINAYGLVSSALKKAVPYYRFDVTLPSKYKKHKELLEPQTIMQLVRGTEIELPVLLAMWLSLRMSEVLGIKKSTDIKNGYLTINQVKVYADGKYIVKEVGKTYDSKRRLQLPPYILSLIDAVADDQEFLIALSGQAIYKRFTRLVERNGLGHMTFHDLRHVNASVMAMLGIPDKYAMERGGWSTDEVLKNTYQHTFSKERQAVDMKIDAYFENCLHESLHVSSENA